MIYLTKREFLRNLPKYLLGLAALSKLDCFANARNDKPEVIARNGVTKQSRDIE